jgi:hypothetical protein
VISGQNLIKNPNFENTSGFLADRLSFGNDITCNGWKGFGTADYYQYKNTDWFPCYSPQYTVPPKCGDGFAGFFVFSTLSSNGVKAKSPSVEIIQAELKKELEYNKKYEIKFYISLDKDFYASKYFGVYFSNSSDYANCNSATRMGSYIHYDECYDSNMRADIEITDYEILTDTNWVEVRAIYTAKGGEKYVNFGLFWLENKKVIKVYNKVKRDGLRYLWKYKLNRKRLTNRIAKEILIENPHKKGKKTECTDQGKYAYYFIDCVSVTLIEE